MRRLVHLILLLCLPLYGFAMQGGLPHAGAAAFAHALEHEQGVQHHHHEDDGSVHYDTSDESRDHAQEHSCHSHPFGFSLPCLIVPHEQAASVPASYVARAVPEPFLDGPHRPPAFAPGPAAGGMSHA